jgi:hypothetical protein
VFLHFVIGDTACEFQIGFVSVTSSFTARVFLSDFYYPDLFKALVSLPDDHFSPDFDHSFARRFART